MGIQRMRRAIAKAGLKDPTFDANGYFRAIFHRPATGSRQVAHDRGKDGREPLGTQAQPGSQKSSQKILSLLALIR